MESQQKEAEVFYCEGCGGIQKFDIERQTFRCENCGTEVERVIDRTTVEEHSFEAHLRNPRNDEWEQGTDIQRCESCGAEMIVPHNATAVHCAYCGSAHVLTARQGEGVRPEAIVPFRVNKHQVGELFRKWIKGKWFAPGTLKHLYQQDKLQAVYLPYWTYDADTTAHYTGQGGRVYYVTVKRGDKTVRERRVRWYPVSGSLQHFFDDVLVSAKKDTDKLEKKAGSFSTKECVPFDMAYLSGYSAEKYTVNVEEGYTAAREIMRGTLYGMARSDILRRYDEAQVHSLDAHFFNVKFKHILLPMWMSGYAWQNQIYRFLVNGQTGKIVGNYPKSKVRIAIAIVLGIALAALAFWLLQEYS